MIILGILIFIVIACICEDYDKSKEIEKKCDDIIKKLEKY